MDVSERLIAAICPHDGCDQAIHVANRRFRGGVNDRGGFVIECAKCKKQSYIGVSNPDDLSAVTSGGRVVDTWDDEIHDRSEFLAACGLSAEDELRETMLMVQPEVTSGPAFEVGERAIYRCPSCKDNLEAAAYDELRRQWSGVLDLIQQALVEQRFQKRSPDAVELTLKVACSCQRHELQFYRSLPSSGLQLTDASDFILAGPADPAMLTDVDGVYGRDDCIEMLKKLLLRWRARHLVVVLVVPFIGLDYPGREANKVDLWNMVLGHTDPNGTLLLTRRATYNGFLEAAKTQGIDLALLKKFNLLTPMLDELSSKKALFKQQSHAKFYAAVGNETTEVLSGSFNLHTGEYVENLIFKSYPTADFIERYLWPLEVVFNPDLLRVERELLRLRLPSRS